MIGICLLYSLRPRCFLAGRGAQVLGAEALRHCLKHFVVISSSKVKWVLEHRPATSFAFTGLTPPKKCPVDFGGFQSC